MVQPPRRTRDSGVTVLLGGFVVTVAIGVLAAVLGGVVDGSTAAWGALVGALVVAVVCAGGSLMVNVVAGVLPTASLLFALLTYTLQVLVLLMVFVALERSDLLGARLDREWLGVTAVVATLVWLATLVLLSTRRRIPAFDLPAPDGAAEPREGRPHGAEGGER